MISNLPLDHQAWIHPIQVYVWMHDLYKACMDIYGIEMPGVQSRRLNILQTARFLEDDSGRSTGKTHNYLLALGIISLCLPLHDTIWFGREAEIGREVFDKHYGQWIEYCPNFRRFVTTKGRYKPQVSGGKPGAKIMFYNGSRARSISPDPLKEYKKMQSWRCNHGIFNEWQDWPHIQEIPDKVEPIFTNTNLQYRQTRLFRESIEKSMRGELGRLSNEELNARHNEQDYIPRDYLEEAVPDPWHIILETFYRNFEITFGFDYHYGIEDENLQFEPIRNKNALVMFFHKYDEGDPVYFNKLIYDGSARRPSDDCHWLHKQIAERIKEGNKLYAHYGIGIDDVPRKWDGIIYDSTIVEKARKTLLTEDFNRIWLGKWTEGRAKNPFSWQEVMVACKEGWLGQVSRQNSNEVFVGAIDSAQGTDATFKTVEGIKDGRGDDGVVAIFRLGDGTVVNPHQLCYIYIAEDIRSEPMAFDIQCIENRFGSLFYMLDPGGGGKGVMEKLAKKKLEKTDAEGNYETMDVTPMLPWDHQDPGDSKTNICIFSLSNEMITTAYIDSKTGKALLQYDDQLNNKLITLMKDALRDRTVAFTQFLERDEIVELYKSGKINDDQLTNFMNIRKAMSQLVHLRYVTDRQGKRIKNSRGLFRYTSIGKKDAAWTILMGYMMCDILVQINKLQESDEKDKDHYPDIA